MRLLIIEDEVALRDQVRDQLLSQGYEVDASGEGNEGLFMATEYPVDLAIVDLGLPGISGLEVISGIREQGHSYPILILTARGKWEEKVIGLEAGADDYLVKPFHMEELMARIRALLRRAVGSTSNELNYGPIGLDTGAQKATLNNTPLDLTAYEYRLLEYLARRSGQAISKSELGDYLYPHDDDRESNVIEVLIGRLRKKLDPDQSLNPIETLRGRGYRFTLEAT
jgi:two-component system response regulator PhoP